MRQAFAVWRYRRGRAKAKRTMPSVAAHREMQQHCLDAPWRRPCAIAAPSMPKRGISSTLSTTFAASAPAIERSRRASAGPAIISSTSPGPTSALARMPASRIAITTWPAVKAAPNSDSRKSSGGKHDKTDGERRPEGPARRLGGEGGKLCPVALGDDRRKARAGGGLDGELDEMHQRHGLGGGEIDGDLLADRGRGRRRSHRNWSAGSRRPRSGRSARRPPSRSTKRIVFGPAG